MTDDSFSNDLKLVKMNYQQVRERLLNRQEIALLDVREEAAHAQGHPLFAANFPFSHIELNADTRLPRKDVPIVTIDSGEGLAESAARRFIDLGYSDVAVFEGGVQRWVSAGGELFIDVNVPSKAFGELMESVCHTPSLAPLDVKAAIESGDDYIIVDVRRFDEYQTMCIPGGTSVPGAEIVLRVPEMLSSDSTKVIVNCAGRTRGLIGAQSLINAGLPNPIFALRNGTIGWTLARQRLEIGQVRKYPDISHENLVASQRMARAVAERTGVRYATCEDVENWSAQDGRTTYLFDVRSVEEFELGHLPGFKSSPGGQLVQELDMFVPVRGARIVLADDNGVRACMTASWLAQMAWEVFVLDGVNAAAFIEKGQPAQQLPEFPKIDTVDSATLAIWLETESDTAVVDLSSFEAFCRGHIPGAWYVIRSLIDDSVALLPTARRFVLTCPNSYIAHFAAPELAKRVEGRVFVLAGGNKAWVAAGFKLESGDSHKASPAIDRYRRPYEGTEISEEAMQAYLDWEFGLIEQLRRDGTHHFTPLRPRPN